MAKYKKKFAKQLKNGLRSDKKMSIPRVCILWGITPRTYYSWIDKHPEFGEAHEMGERDYQAEMLDLIVEVAAGERKGNAGNCQLIAKNVLGWSDRVELHKTQDEEIRTININVLPSKSAEPLMGEIIEHDESIKYITDQESS